MYIAALQLLALPRLHGKGRNFSSEHWTDGNKRETYITEGYWKKSLREVHFWPHLESTEMLMQKHWVWIQKIMTTIPTLTFISCGIQFSRSVISKSLQPHGLQHARPPCPSPTLRVYSSSCPLSWWCHPTTTSSVVPFSSHLQSLPESGSFPMSQFFASGGQSIGVSASALALPMNIQWFPLGWTGWISLQSKGLSRVFSNTTVQKHQFSGTQLSL